MAHTSAWIADYEQELAERYEREHACHAQGCDHYHVDDTERCDDCGDYFCAAHLTRDDRWLYCPACADAMRADEAAQAAAWEPLKTRLGIAA
jgi:hypothetical protein